MNNVNIKIPTAEEINKQITESIADSMIGKSLEKAMKDYFEEITKGRLYGENVFKDVVKKTIEIHLAKLLQSDEYEKIIRNKLKECLTEEVISEVIGLVFDAYFNKSR